jgi:site-specific DNA recombinase
LLLSSILDGKEYRIIKSEAEEQLLKLEARLIDATNQRQNSIDVESIVEKALFTLSNLDDVCQKADVNQKCEIIGSIYPEKLVFSENNYQTGRINEVAALICHIYNTLTKEKTETFDENSSQFRLVLKAGVEPAQDCSHTPLKRARLPIPPLQLEAANIKSVFQKTLFLRHEFSRATGTHFRIRNHLQGLRST